MPIIKKIGSIRNNRRLSPRRRWAHAGLGLGAVILAVAVLTLVLGGAILNGYGKRRVQRAFAEARPGCTLQIGKLGYSIGASRLVARSITLSATNSTLKADRISLKGVRWARLLWGKAAVADILARARLDATNLDIEFPRTHYGIRCARLRASVPDSSVIAEGTDLSPMAGDETLCVARAVRTTRYRASIPECRVSGLSYGDLLRGKSYRARSVHFVRPTLDAFAYHYNPAGLFVKSPRMVNEALAAIPRPMQVDSLSITDGFATFRDRVTAGAAPGVLTFTAVNLFAEGIASRAEASAAVVLRAQGKLMDSGVLEVSMTIPLASPDFSLHYTGSLSAMDMTRLDAFLDIVQHIHINSGRVEKADFEIDVAAGLARGRVRTIYRDLNISVLDKQSGTKEGMGNRVTSFMANQFKFRDSNAPETWASMKEGKVDYKRKPGDTFLQFAWLALQSGVLDVISRDAR